MSDKTELDTKEGWAFPKSFVLIPLKLLKSLTLKTMLTNGSGILQLLNCGNYSITQKYHLWSNLPHF